MDFNYNNIGNYQKNPPLSPTAFAEDVVNNNQELLSKLENDKEFTNWFNTLIASERVNSNLNRDLMQMLFADEIVPGEVLDSEYAYINNNYQVPFSTRLLRNAGRTEAPRLIKNTRNLQFTEYGKPSFSKREPGLVAEFEDPNYSPTILEKQNLSHFTNILCDKFFYPANCEKPNLSLFLGSAYNDFFDLDDITMEIRRTLGKMPLGIHLTDPTLLYHVIPKGGVKYPRWDRQQDNYERATEYELRNKSTVKDVKYVLIKNNVRLGAFTDERIIKSHFFVSTDIMYAYRGYSILEQGIKMVLNIMNSITYNSSNFNNNRVPNGVFAFTGGFTNRLITEQFKKILYAYLSGANNRFRIPVIGLPERGDAKFIPFNMSSRDMEFHLFVTLLFTIFAQLSGTNPEEVSMSSHDAAMKGRKLFDQAPDGILQISRDKGLNTFLRYFCSIINGSGILKQMTGYNVRCRFNGLEVEDERVKIEVRKLELSSTKSYNMLIKEDGGTPQNMDYGGVNIYDVVGVDSPTIKSVLDARVEALKEQQQQQAAAEQAAQQKSQQKESNFSEKDKELINKHGSPENGVAA